MRRMTFFLAVLLFAGATPSAAETLSVVPGVALGLDLPGQRWELSRQAPEFLLLETAEHLEHELAGQGKQVDTESLKAEAARRLAANEAFVFNPESGAVLTIDFSPLKKNEKAPNDRTVAASARYAGESLASEEGIEGVKSKTDRVKLPGADSAHRIKATYLQHGKPVEFTGIVGFVSPYWFFLYYTDPLRDPRDAGEMEKILESFVLKPARGN